MNSESIPLNRINRLIRPLRATIKSLLFSIALNEARSLALLKQPHQAPGKKGKSKAVDRDYSDGPFNQTKRKKHHAKERYGNSNRNINVGSSSSTSRVNSSGSSTSSATSSCTKSSISMGIRDRLKSAGLDNETTTKALLLFRAYKNILEAIYGLRTYDQVNRNGLMTSLVEIVSREVGWNVEDSVRSSLAEAEEAKDSVDVEDLLSNVNVNDVIDKEGRRRKRNKSAEEEDENKLVSDWYEAVPEYCRGWIFAQHATCIVVESLELSPPILLLILLEMCATIGAHAEASRFLPPLCQRGLQESTSNIQFTSHTLYNISLHLSQSNFFLSTLQDVVLSSSFSDRYFYSSFISATQILTSSPEAGDYACRLLVMQLEVATEMLDSIELEEEESEELDLDTTSQLSTEVIDRLRKELSFSLSILFNRQATTLPALKSVSSAFFNVLEKFAALAIEDLASLAFVLELAIISIILQDFSSSILPPIDLTIHMSRISYLSASLTPTSTEFASPTSNSSLPFYLPLILPFLSTQDVASISILLHSSFLYEVESTLLSKLLAGVNYSLLLDVKTDEIKEGNLCEYNEVTTREVFEERLRLSQEARLDEEDDNIKVGNSESFGGSSSTTKGGKERGSDDGPTQVRKKWRWESMVGTYVVSTPSSIGKSTKRRRNPEQSNSGRKAKENLALNTSPSKIISTPNSLSFSSLRRNSRSIQSSRRKNGDVGTPSRGLGSSKAKKLWATAKLRDKGRRESYWESSEGDALPEADDRKSSGDEEEKEDEQQVEEEFSDHRSTQSPLPFQSHATVPNSSQHSPFSYDQKRKIEVLDLSIDSDYDTRLLFSNSSSSAEISDYTENNQFRLEVLEHPLSPTTPSELDEFVLSQIEIVTANGVKRTGIKKGSLTKSKKVKRNSRQRGLEGSDDELGI